MSKTRLPVCVKIIIIASNQLTKIFVIYHDKFLNDRDFFFRDL